MTLFEYVTVAVSIVLSFGVVRLLDGLRPALAPERRYWVHCLWIATKLLNHALFWWGLWALRDAVTWDLASFLWILLFPGALYLQASALVTTSPGEIRSWREHFYQIRSWYFGVNVFLILHTFASSALLVGVPALHVSRLPLLFVLLVNLAGMRSAEPRLHAAIAILVLLNQILGFGAILFRPGALAVG